MAGEPVAGTGLTAVTGGLAGAEGGPLEWTTTADGLKDTLVKAAAGDVVGEGCGHWIDSSWRLPPVPHLLWRVRTGSPSVERYVRPSGLPGHHRTRTPTCRVAPGGPQHPRKPPVRSDRGF